MKIEITKAISVMLILMLTLGVCMVSPETAYAEANSNVAGSAGNELHVFYDSRTVYSEQVGKYIESVDSISFAWSRLDASNPESLNTIQGQDGNNSFYYPEDYAQPLQFAKSKGKSIQINVFMNGADGKLLLPFADKRSLLVQAVVAHLQKEAVPGEGIYFDGVVIDFEGLCDTDSKKNQILYEGKPISRYFVLFLTELKEQLASMGKNLYVAVNPLLYYDGYDYKSILGLADRVILMAHDYKPTESLRKSQVMQYVGYDALGPIDSLAPIGKVRKALNDMMVSTAGTSYLSKVWLQISFDSAQWKYTVSGPGGWDALADSTLNSGERQAPLYKYIKDRVDNKDGYGVNIAVGYNNELQSPWLQYYNTSDKTYNVVLYEDSRSIAAKIDLAKAYGIGGISIWSLRNVPDFTDASGKKYYLDGWDTVQSKTRTPYAATADSKIAVKFTDKAMEKVVRDKLGKSTGSLTAADVKSIYRLKLTAGVKSLNDLKYLTKLEYLDAQSLNISNIAAIGYLANLRVLYLQRNIITDISPLKKLTFLQVVSLNGNKISDIRMLSNLKQLKKLYLRENKLTSVTALSGLANLTTLHLGINNIKDITPLAGLKNVNALSLDSNNLSSIKGLSAMTGLKSLNISYNKISDIQVLKNMKKLETLDLRGNSIVSVLPLKGLSSLKGLYLNGNKIKDFSPLKQLYVGLTQHDFIVQQ